MQCTLYTQTIRSKKIRTSILDLGELMTRIRTDERRRRTVEAFRKELKDLPPSLRSQTLERLPRICPGEVVRRRRDGSQKTAYTGIVTLELDDVTLPEEKRRLKALATSWPTTIAVVEGANGNSLRILVRGTYDDGSLPADRAQSERFHQELYKRCAAVYASVLGRAPKSKEAHIDDSFFWTYDPTPYFDDAAAAVKVSRSLVGAGLDGCQPDADAYGQGSSRPSADNKNLWRRRFALAVNTARDKSSGDVTAEAALEVVALEALRLNIPQEDAVRQAACNAQWRDIDSDRQRAIIESVYLEHNDQRGRNRSHAMQETTYRLQTFMQQRYDLRYNVLTNGVEWRCNDAASFDFLPLDSRVMNTMVQECHESGLEVLDRDMRRFLGSTRIRDYNAAHAYLNDLDMTWDGTTDHIRALAERIPCRNPHWQQWFHQWFLSMVARWSGDGSTYGFDAMPLLIGRPGCGKDSFARLLLPPELRNIGFREMTDVNGIQEAERLLATSLLVNIEEIGRVNKKTQQMVLRNMIQGNTIKGRRPYSSALQDMPCYASLIATSGTADILNDARGARRFIVADIRDGATVDNATPINYPALYAQALTELRQERRYTLTPEEAQAIEAYNATFNAMRPEVSRFLDIFELTSIAEADTKKMKISDITRSITQRTGYTYDDKARNCLGRWLTAEARAGRVRRTMSNGCPHYLLKVV